MTTRRIVMRAGGSVKQVLAGRRDVWRGVVLQVRVP